jgi:hypothetical protein
MGRDRAEDHYYSMRSTLFPGMSQSLSTLPNWPMRYVIALWQVGSCNIMICIESQVING